MQHLALERLVVLLRNPAVRQRGERQHARYLPLGSTQRNAATERFTRRTVYAQNGLHTERFTVQQLLSTHRTVYTQNGSQSNATQRPYLPHVLAAEDHELDVLQGFVPAVAGTS